MGTPELFPGESTVREEVLGAGWLETIGNGWALVFASLEDANLTLRVYPSFFLEDVAPAFLLVETLEGNPARAPLGLQAWVSTHSGRIPTPEEAMGLLDRSILVRPYETVPEAKTEENPHRIYRLTPERIRQLPKEEVEKREREARARRSQGFRELYEALNLRVVANKDRSLEITWSGGEATLRCTDLRGRGPTQVRATPAVTFRARLRGRRVAALEVAL